MYLNQDMQLNMQSISQIEAVPSDVLDWNDLPKPQPFVVPQDCGQQYTSNPQNDCLAR